MRVASNFKHAFLSTLSLRRATPLLMFWLFRLSRFLSTLSLRRATISTTKRAHIRSNFYPRSPCGERHALHELSKKFIQISIHALLAESDIYNQNTVRWNIVISIHALLAESDIVMAVLLMFSLYFYPRSPCGERPVRRNHAGICVDFYPRSPCGERLYDTYAKVLRVNISIHALLAESDQAGNGLAGAPPQISIHALLAESDSSKFEPPIKPHNFYPRSPCGERPQCRL